MSNGLTYRLDRLIIIDYALPNINIILNNLLCASKADEMEIHIIWCD